MKLVRFELKISEFEIFFSKKLAKAQWKFLKTFYEFLRKGGEHYRKWVEKTGSHHFEFFLVR